MRKLVRTAVAVVLAAEGAAFLLGAALHVGVPIPGPYDEPGSLVSAALEAIAGAALLLAAAATAARPRLAWKLAIGGNVFGVLVVAWGIVSRGGGYSTHASHHPPMLLLLIVVLIALSVPAVRHAIENGRHRSRRRRRVLQTLM